MKIPASNLGATSAASGLGRNIDRLAQTSSRSDTKGTVRPAATDRIDVGQEVGDSIGGLSSQERLDRLAARFEARLDHLMQREGLSDEQLAALGQTKEDFQALVDRLSNALDTLQPGVAARAFRGIVHDMRESVRDALGRTHGENVDVGDAARAGGVDGDVEGTDPLEQLDAVGERLQARFESYFSQDGLDERLVQELMDAKASFESALQRLHDAYENGDKDVSFLRKGFDTALAGLRDELASIFGEDHAYGKPDTHLRADSVTLYGSDGGSTPLAQPDQGSFDHVV
jgi:hypothetical protein